MFLESIIFHYNSYSVKDMTFCVGIMFRALLEKEELHKTLLKVEYIEKLSNYIMDATFDVASDAIDSLTVSYLPLIGNIYT